MRAGTGCETCCPSLGPLRDPELESAGDELMERA